MATKNTQLASSRDAFKQLIDTSRGGRAVELAIWVSNKPSAVGDQGLQVDACSAIDVVTTDMGT